MLKLASNYISQDSWATVSKLYINQPCVLWPQFICLTVLLIEDPEESELRYFVSQFSSRLIRKVYAYSDRYRLRHAHLSYFVLKDINSNIISSF